jgi:serine acetyltransferase
VIGGIKIGDNAVVGAGAVVVEDVPAGCTIVDIPEKRVKSADDV